MKNLLRISILFAFTFGLLSCNKDKEPDSYYTKLYYFTWDVNTNPLILSSSALDQTFQIKDGEGNPGGIIGVPGMLAGSQQDTVRIENTGLNSDLKNSILSDTIRGTWFTIITEEERRLRVILDKNEETKTRSLAIAVWVSRLDDSHDGVPMCDQLIIYQLPLKKD